MHLSDTLFSLAGVGGLLVTFDKRTRLSAKDTLSIYSDEACTQLLGSASGQELSAYLPLALPHAEVWVQFTCAEANRAAHWGWHVRVSPLVADLHLSLWVCFFSLSLSHYPISLLLWCLFLLR